MAFRHYAQWRRFVHLMPETKYIILSQERKSTRDLMHSNNGLDENSEFWEEAHMTQSFTMNPLTLTSDQENKFKMK